MLTGCGKNSTINNNDGDVKKLIYTLLSLNVNEVKNIQHHKCTIKLNKKF